MKGFAVCFKGFEDITALEVKELIGKNAEIEESVVLFESKEEDLVRLGYNGQSIRRVCSLLGSFSFSKMEDLGKFIGNCEFEFVKGKSFKVKCLREGKHDFNSQDVNESIGEVIFEKTKAKVKMDDPEVIVFVYIFENKCYFGIDHCGLDVGKRDYKIFSHPSSLNSVAAYSLLRLSGYNCSGVVLDPFCGAGTIPIEAAFFASGKSCNYYRKDKFIFDVEKLDKEKKFEGKIVGYDNQLRNVTACKKNAKIAGVNKEITFSRMDVEWLDTKFDEKGVDFIVSQPPIVSKSSGLKDIEKVYKEFFYQSEFVLKNGGKIAVILLKDELFKKFISDKFKISEERDVLIKKQKMIVLVLEKR